MKKIALGSDHAGYDLKEAIKKWLNESGYEVLDFGTDSNTSCDYPDFIFPAGEAVANGQADCGIVFGGSGNGEAIAANKIKGIRCAVCWHEDSGRLAKQHNNANIIALGGRMVNNELGIKIVKEWLYSEFEGDRHLRRINKIAEYEK